MGTNFEIQVLADVGMEMGVVILVVEVEARIGTWSQDDVEMVVLTWEMGAMHSFVGLLDTEMGKAADLAGLASVGEASAYMVLVALVLV